MVHYHSYRAGINLAETISGITSVTAAGKIEACHHHLQLSNHATYVHLALHQQKPKFWQ